MSDRAPGTVPTDVARERLLGRMGADPDGPTLLVTVAIHGNELAGVRAAERVLLDLGREQRDALQGRVIVLVGNRAALRQRTRFVDLDLNRQWTPDEVGRLDQASGRDAEVVERGEQRALLEILRTEIGAARGPVYFLDLHTSSAEGPPFLTIGDTLINRRFVRAVPLPVILGLEEQVDGSLLEYLSNHGVVTLGVEGGQHDAASSVDRIEAVLWIALVAAGLLEARAVPRLARLRRFLAAESHGIPRMIEVRHRHPIAAGDGFRMEPGFRNFQPVRVGQALGGDRRGVVLCPQDGLVLLPLYQGKGDDGFFVAREFRPVWLTVSALLRRARAEWLLRLLPGVRRHPSGAGTLIADTRIARYFPLELFHLVGFRKVRREGVFLTITRRTHDLRQPGRIDLA